jgi:UDP-2,3-diacylglucosamine hydrolase
MPPKLGILAGGGELPRLLIEACRNEGRPFHVVAFRGHAEDATVAEAPHDWVRLGAVADTFRVLRSAGAEELVFAGRIARPSLAELRPDWRAARFIARIGGRLLSDNSLLEGIVREFEQEGFHVIGPADVTASLLARPGPYGRLAPTAAEAGTIALGLAAARTHGLADRGQAAVVQADEVLGLEGPEGTDALIAGAAPRQAGGAGAILVKARKPQQQMRADPPVIGVGTIRRAASARFRGIAVEAGGVLVIDAPAIAAIADAAEMFVVGIEAA